MKYVNIKCVKCGTEGQMGVECLECDRKRLQAAQIPFWDWESNYGKGFWITGIMIYLSCMAAAGIWGFIFGWIPAVIGAALWPLAWLALICCICEVVGK